MVDIASLAIQIDTSDVARAENDLERLGTKGAKAEQAAKGVGDAYQQAAGKVGGVAGAATQAGTALERNSVAARENARELASVDRTASSLSGSMSKLGATLAGLTAGMSIKGIIDISDNYGQMADRIKMATASTEEYRMVQERLLQSANRTYRPLAEAQELYIRTADAIRSLGYQTSDALDITDSFSYLLVTNAASADKASNAIDAYSKSIQSGRIEADSWQSLIAAMPSVVDTLSGSLGKSAEEIRQLGITGKLSLADLNEGLRQTVEQNQKLADGMGTTLNDAIVRASNNLSTYLGESSKVTASSRLLSGALDGVTENIDLIASVLGGAAVAAITRYTVVTGQSTYASIAHAVAVKRQAAEELQLAKAQVASTAAAVAQARANVGLVGSMGQVTAALTAQEAAQKRLAAAQASSVSLGRTVLGLAGGWVGIALTAGAVAASFYDWSDSANEVERSAVDLTGPLDTLIDKWKELGDAQRVSMGRQAEQDLKATTQTMAEEAAKVEAAFYKLGNVKGLPVESWIAPLREFREAAANGGQGINDFAQQLLDGVPAGSDFRRIVEDAAAAIEAQGGKAETLRGFLKTLEDQTRNNASANRELADTSDATGNSFLQSLQRRADLSGKLTEVQKTQISIEKGYAGVLSESAKQEALAAAATIDRANAALNAGKGVAKATDEQARAFKTLYDNLYPAEAAQRQYNDQVDLLKKYLSGDQLAKAIDRLNFAMEGADATGPADAIEEYRKELQRLEDQLDPVGKATKQYQQDVKRLDDALGRGELTIERHAELMAELGRQYDENRGVTSDWAKWTEGALDRVDSAFADAWRNIGDGFSSFRDSLTNAFKQMLAELAHMAITKPIIMQIGAAMGIGGGTQGNNGIWGSLLGGGSASGGGAGGIGGALQAANQARSLYSMYGTAQTLLPVLQGGYASGGIGGALTGIGSYVGSLFGGAGTAASMAAGSTAAGYTGSAYASWAAAQAAGGAGAGGIGGGISGALSSAGSMWWLAPLLGMYQSAKFWDDGVRISGKDTSRLNNGSRGAVGDAAWAPFTAGSYAIELMDKSLSFVADPLNLFGKKMDKLVAVLTGSPVTQGITNFIGKGLFGGGWEVKNYGLALGATNGDFIGQAYRDEKKDGGWFSSDKKRTRYSALDEETLAALQGTFDATKSGVAGIFEALSFSVDEGSLAGLQLARQKISTKGKTEEEIKKAVGEWFEKTANAMTAELNKVFATGLDLDLEGMQAFVGNLQGVNETLRYLDVGMYDASVAGGKLAEALSAAAGGLDALATNSQTYYAAFFTDAEKVEDTIDSIKRAFESADVELAASRQAYRAMVEDIDLTTEAGQEMFATLMQLSGQAAQYYSIVEQQAAAAAAQALANTQLYYDQFTTAGQKTEDVLTGIVAQFEELELTLPGARDGFIAAVDALDTTTEAGKKMFDTLMSVAGAADAYYDILEQRASQAVGNAYSLLERSVNAEKTALAAAYQQQKAEQDILLQQRREVQQQYHQGVANSYRDMAQTASATASALSGLSSAISSALGELVDDSLSVVEQRRFAAVAQLRSALVTGDLSNADQLAEAARTAASVDSGVFGSLEDFRREQGRTANLLAELGDLTTGRQTAAEQQAESLQKLADQSASNAQTFSQSIGSVKTSIDYAYEAELAALDEQLALGKSQIDALNGIDNSVVSVADAVSGLAAAITAAMQQIPGLSSITVPGFAAGGSFGGGLRLVGERGPELEVTGPSRIYNASQTASMLNSGGAETAAEVRALRQETGELRAYLYQIAKNTGQTASGIRRQNEIGIPEAV